MTMLEESDPAGAAWLLQRGGDFAEIFVEDAGCSSAGFDDGKVEDLPSSREPWGLRSGSSWVRPPGSPHTTDLSEYGLAEPQPRRRPRRARCGEGERVDRS